MSHPLLPTVDELTRHHASLALETHADATCTPAAEGVQALAYAAARRLGFIEADARCVAHAWERQTARTGCFIPVAWPDHAQDFGLASPADDPSNAFAACPNALGVYAVLPTAEWVARMAAAGVPTVQLRFKSADPQAIRQEVQAAVKAVEGTRSLLFINDHWREAIAAGAYGVHLGQEDLDTLSSEDLDTIRRAGLRLGLSTHGYAEMLKAAAVRPSYLALGAVFPTTLKAMKTPPQGLGRLHAYARLAKPYPLVAIGGIAQEHLPAVASTGVGSFAVVRAITGSDTPEAAAQALMSDWSMALASCVSTGPGNLA